jgi:hypothetical protein
MAKTGFAWSAAALLGALVLGYSAVAHSDQRFFETPEAAAQALVDAVLAEDTDVVRAVLGPGSGELSSGDPVADRTDREAFVEAAVESAAIEQEDGVDDRAVLVIGDDWPFPIPLVKVAEGWHFDMEDGLEEIYRRRIGNNELYAISVASAYGEAQEEYASVDRNGDGVREFAQRLASSEGQRDGLYWPVKDGEPESPMGPLVADAVAEGYAKSDDGEPVPYHGYFYRMLPGQGASAPGGAESYVVDGRMTGGYALLAYPAEYGNSGIMSFMINQQGMVFEKDLGEDTESLARAMEVYDPDTTWDPVTD